MTDTKISARIAEIKAAALSVDAVTLNRVIQQLARIAFTDITQVVEWGGTNVGVQMNEITGARKIVVVPHNEIRLRSSSEIGAGAAAVVAKIWRNADGSISGVTMREPLPALVALGRHLGMWPTKTGPRASARGTTNNGHQSQPLVYVDRPPPI